MKVTITFLLFIGLFACNTTDDNNPVLPDVAVNTTVFLNNPTNNDLLFVGGYVEIQGGIKGIVVYRSTNDTFFAYDLACPHLAVNECTKMTVNGLFMICTCDNSKFALALGGAPQSDTPYPAKEYKIVKNGNTLKITNF